ncbi:alginate export family protein [Sphingomonas sp. PB2P19]|uniref:alginate export family protein n=1 Tax=Sphingomonas rhamnosi TaxID=3096156 RepID=UPI002FC5843F
MISYRIRIAKSVQGVAALTATLLAGSALAQSVPPESTTSSAAGGPLSSQTPPGVRPPKSQALPAEALPGGRSGPQGVPQAIRWTENWSAAPAADAPILEKIRHIPIGSADTYLSLGGEARVYYTDWNHSALGLRTGDNNDPVQLRLRLLADLHVGQYVRAFVELGDNREFGEQTATAPNRGKLDIQQAFVDITLPLGDAGKITVRPGRFEMPLGNGKLVGVREGLNQRFTYQGVRGTYILPGTVSVDVFALRPVNIKPGTLDDGPNHTIAFTGVYVSAPNRVAGFGTDVYWYEMNRDRGVLREGTGKDDRNSWGARIWRRTSSWDLDVEGTYQSGTFTTEDIRAWAVLFEGGYTFAEAPMTPRLGLRGNVFSGDGDLTDGKAGTFVAAAPRLPLISEAAFFNLSNLMDLYPSVTVKPRKDVTIMVGPDFLWRNSRADGVYIGPAGSSFAPYASSRVIGTDLNLEASWQATKRVQFRLFETYFSASDSFAAHGGQNGNYLGVLSDLRF